MLQSCLNWFYQLLNYLHDCQLTTWPDDCCSHGRKKATSINLSPRLVHHRPAPICGCVIPEQGRVRADRKSYTVDLIAIMMDHLSLAAADLGFGTCCWSHLLLKKLVKPSRSYPMQIQLNLCLWDTLLETLVKRNANH